VSYISLANQDQFVDVVVLILCFLLQAKRKFIILCLITRLSVTLQRNENMDLQEVEFIESSEIFKLVSTSFNHSTSYTEQTHIITISNSTINPVVPRFPAFFISFFQ
jgi:hypothetical protein